MEQGGFSQETRKFNSPEEELHFLREKVAQKEKQLDEIGFVYEKVDPVRKAIADYKNLDSKQILDKNYAVPQSHAEQIVLELAPEPHDRKMEELLGIMHTKGIKNALYIVDKMNNPHIEDDFHRLLVEYIKKGFPVAGLKEKTPLSKSLRSTLYEIALPESVKGEREKPIKEIISSMEQFYSGMLSISGEKEDETLTIELAVSNGSEEFIFYASVPDSKKGLFEKQILSIFPKAKIYEKKDDYNIFNENGISVGSYGKYSKNAIFPIKTYEQFDYDPLNITLNTFSKIKKDGEGAAIQIIFKPRGSFFISKFKKALKDLEKGVKPKKALDIRYSFMSEVAKDLGEVLGDFVGGGDPKKKDKSEPPQIDQTMIENIKNKVSSQVVSSNIRIIASASSRPRASEILSEIESSFNQLENTTGNSITFQRVEKSKLTQLFKDFSFRTFSSNIDLPISIKELTTFMHFPSESIAFSPQLKKSKAGTSPAPIDMPSSGILLGVNRDRNLDMKVYITREDRLRHMYTIGQTGTGKSVLLKNIIMQDILNGDGVCMIDPHGSDIQDVLSRIPKERYEDVIYFDPSYTARPMALNMLEYDPKYPEQKTFVVNELLSIFNKLFDMKVAGGPMFEQYFRNSVLLVMEDPESGNTLLDVSRVLADKAFRDMKLSRCKNPVVVQYWREIAEKAGGEASLANIVPYITSKFDVFLSNDIMRPIIAQEKSAFNFREIMDNKKILLVNLSKGRLGDINANLIGLILVGKILMAALSRVDSLGKSLPDFYLHIDEFQNITTDSIATILSEARKYKLSLSVAHQYIAQLDEKIKDAVFGNVGSIVSFRVGAEDAEFLEKQFSPVFSANDLINLDNYNAYLKILINGKPAKPFNMETIKFEKGSGENLEMLKQLSYTKYGRDRAEVEDSIINRYKKQAPPQRIL
ncbi:TraM recognition domain-containing protein [Candidatus Nomurabacteria bacterium]|nr:TraM recognition domain-containing protein [Candidatus Nomurabacteria bacterium]